MITNKVSRLFIYIGITITKGLCTLRKKNADMLYWLGRCSVKALAVCRGEFESHICNFILINSLRTFFLDCA